MAKKIDIGGELHSVATDHKVADASEIKDISKGNKSQADFNNDIDRHEVEIHGIGGIESRLTDVEQLGQIALDGGKAQIAQGSDFTNPDATKRAKIPTVGAIVDGLNDGIYDISKRNSTSGPNNDGKFTLEYILNNANTLIPTSWRHGGMTISFIQSSDNKYVQYRLMSDSFSLTISDWQGVDDIPTASSKNLVESGGVKISSGDKCSFVGLVQHGLGLDGVPVSTGFTYTSDFVRIQPLTALYYKLKAWSDRLCIAFYSGKDHSTFISGVIGKDVMESGSVVIPENANYMKYSTIEPNNSIMKYGLVAVPHFGDILAKNNRSKNLLNIDGCVRNAEVTDYIGGSNDITYLWDSETKCVSNLIALDGTKQSVVVNATFPFKVYGYKKLSDGGLYIGKAESSTSSHYTATLNGTANIAFIRLEFLLTDLTSDSMVSVDEELPASFISYENQVDVLSGTISINKKLNDGDILDYRNSNDSVALGKNALAADGGNTKYNVAIGVNALMNARCTLNDTEAGKYNVAIGWHSMQNSTTGNHNTAVGYGSGASLTTGVKNTIIGEDCMFNITEGIENTCVGVYAAFKITTGDYNVIMGKNAAYELFTGSANVIIGVQAGYRQFDESRAKDVRNDNQLTLIGWYAQKNTEDEIQDSTAIGARAEVSKSHQVRLGSENVETVDTYGDIECLTNSRGIILRSPNGTPYKISVSNDGTLNVALLN